MTVDDGAAVIVVEVDGAFREIRTAAEALDGPGLERRTSAGWTAKEMLAHVAFWEEAAVPVIAYMLRGKAIPLPWRFESFTFAGPEWPPFEVHNQREAAWGREHTAAEVLARWDLAHAALLDALRRVSGAEAEEHRGYFAELSGHLREHLGELRGLKLL
jgi:hypothetical protein